MSSGENGKALVAGPDDEGRRLDKVLRKLLPGTPLSSIYQALRKGHIRLNGGRSGPDRRLAAGDRITLPASMELRSGPAAPAEGKGEELDSLADILILATEDLLFLNKPRGLVAQGDEGLEGRVRGALAARSSASLSFTPGPLHRRDRNTTGVLTFPRSAAGARSFSELIRRRGLEKRYLALVDGDAGEAAEWRDSIARDEASLRSYVDAGGDEALASMRPLASAAGRSLILVELHTGLTHQIRVQASSRGMPLAGDSKYGGSPFPGGYILHAVSLGFPEPPFPDLPRRVTAPLPPSAAGRLAKLFGEEVLERILESLGA